MLGGRNTSRGHAWQPITLLHYSYQSKTHQDRQKMNQSVGRTFAAIWVGCGDEGGFNSSQYDSTLVLFIYLVCVCQIL